MNSHRRVRRLFAALCCVLLAGIASRASADEQSLVPRTHPRLGYPPGQTAVVDVTVAIVIDEHGDVVSARVRDRQPADAPAAFDQAALSFAHQLAFEPVLRDGQPSSVQTELHLHFEPPASPSGPVQPDHSHDDEQVGEGAGPRNTGLHLSARVAARRAPTSASDFHLHLDALRAVPRASSVDMLSSAPGVLLTNHGGDGHAPSIFLRGFDAGEGQDLEFLLDGIPVNEVSNPHSHGYADAHFIIPELVDELRVIEGPFDPRQGDFAVAGSAEYHLGLHERGVRTQFGLGTFGAKRLLVLWGPPGEEAGTFAGVDLRQSDGFGANRASSSVSLMSQYETRLGADTRLSLLGQSYFSRFASAGVLREDDFRSGRLPCASDSDSQFFCTYDSRQGGAVSRHGLGMRFSRKLGRTTLSQQLFLSRRDLRIIENYTGYLHDVPQAGEAQRGDAAEKLYGATTAGLRGSAQWQRRMFGRRQELELGYLARYDAGNTLSRRLRGEGSEAYKRDFDVDFGIANVGLWLSAQLRPLERLTLRGGLRADSFSFQLRDQNRPTVDRYGVREPMDARDAFGLALQPRLTMQWRLLPGLDWVTSAGRGARSSDVAALSDGEFAPFGTVTAAETGLVWEHGGGPSEDRPDAPSWNVGARALAYATRVDQALVFDEASARNEFAGPSNRFGALALGRVSWSDWLDAQASVTYAEAYQPAPGAPWWEVWNGARMPYVPRWVGRLDASARRTAELFGQRISWTAGLGATAIAPRPLPLGRFSDPILTIDAGASARWNRFELGLQSQNLLDARYRLAEYNYASSFRGASDPPSLRASRHFSAGPPRTVMATFAVHFDEAAGFGSAGHDVHSSEGSR